MSVVDDLNARNRSLNFYVPVARDKTKCTLDESTLYLPAVTNLSDFIYYNNNFRKQHGLKLPYPIQSVKLKCIWQIMIFAVEKRP